MIAALVVIAAVAGVTAQLPVVDNSLVVGAGADLSGPVVVVTAAPRAFKNGLLPFVVVDAAVAGPRLAVQGGLQLRHDVCSGFYVRGSVSGGGFVAGGSNVGAGVAAAIDVDAGFVVGPVDILVGPVVDTAVAIDSARVTPGVEVVVIVDVVDHVEAVVGVNGGYDLGGVYGHAADGAVAADFVVGVRVAL